MSRTRWTTSVRCGANSLKSLALRASTQNTSARAVAFASRAISDGGVRDSVIALTAHFTQVGARPVLEVRSASLGTFQQTRNFGRGQQRVMLGLERGQLFAAHVGAAPRHHHGSIPAQQRQRAAERMKAPELLFQLIVGRSRHPAILADGRPAFISTGYLNDPMEKVPLW